MTNSRGSIWRKCDFHIHSPFSALNNQFGNDFDLYVKNVFKKAIEKNISVIGITDYFTIDGYKKIKTEYLENDLKLKEIFTIEEVEKIKGMLVLPNIEFRLNKIIQIIKKVGAETKIENGRVNFHVIFSNEVPIKTIEENFLHDIDFLYESEPDEKDKRKKLKLDNIVALGKRLKTEQSEIKGEDAEVGMAHAVVDDEDITEILTTNNDFKEKYFIVVPSDEDLSEISWKSQDGLTRKVLLSRAHAFFSSNSKTIEFGLGEKSESIEEFKKEFKSLKPCIWGSDAHNFEKLFEPDLKRYCWIKADPTFEGMRQILFEPKDRVYIGSYPELFTRIRNNQSNYINSLELTNIPTYDGAKGVWFKDFHIPFGLELIAIIGNKGKGKSAIADILGLLGNSHIEKKDYSFLNTDKFCQKGYSENFMGTLKWFDKTEVIKPLNSNVDFTNVERVKYIPQSYLEKLCNTEDGAFKEEINKVVFSRLEDADKLGKNSFLELEEYQTQLINQRINELKTKLFSSNKLIEALEIKKSTDYLSTVKNKLTAKRQELANHEIEKEKIKHVENPETDISSSEEQRKKAENLAKINAEILRLESLIEIETKSFNTAKISFSELEIIKQEVLAVVESFEEWKKGKREKYLKYELNIDEIIKLSSDTTKIESLLQIESNKINLSTTYLSKQSTKNSLSEELSLVVKLLKNRHQKEIIEKDLEKPFKDWQEYQRLLKEWEEKRKLIIGTGSTDSTIIFLENELNYLQNILPTEIVASINERRNIVKEIYNQKKLIQEVYNKMKIAISEILKEYSDDQKITIETSFRLNKSFYSQFFDYVNRYGAFYSNGDIELKKITSNFNFNDESQIVEFLKFLLGLDIRFKDGRRQDFYNYICSLDYLVPEYDLRLNGKNLSQLSPGEKGGLLLIFYLILDKNNKPLIIDQPEDNLDNQSVAEILVPYIKIAKKYRQIIMVTHNPNLAIVADAEQIIYMNIDKENNYIVSCCAGGIENSEINNHIVNILEGKMKAFDNRRVKYKRQEV